MNLDRQAFAGMLCSAADLMEEQSDRLSEIDSRFGDGDHGVTIAKIARLIRQRAQLWQEESFQEFLEDLGMAIMEVKGGSAGPLYGTMVGGLGTQLEGVTLLDSQAVQQMFQGCLSEMQDVTTAKVGDKTMMDALIPAVEAVQQSSGEPQELFRVAAQAAQDGARASEGFISKFGRARSYKEQTIGTPDAGAVSTSLFFQGLYQGIPQA
ncbi:MAG: DAK2 domain-containing protein [Eubacteriales bacterium]|jgi:dihydroxyacetone kinase-like protein